MQIPKRLFEGARVAVVAPAGGLGGTMDERMLIIDKCRDRMQRMGIEPVFYTGCLAQYGYLAGSDSVRCRDLTDAFMDPAIEGIFCLRGGYGVQRYLDRLDYDQIRRHPKWFGGYSDITALHTVLNQKAELMTFHTPMPATEMIREDFDDYTEKWLRKAMFESMAGELPSFTRPKCLSGGTAEGVLCGGNLTLLCSSLGTPYEIDTKGKILFLEDVDEDPYRIDRMLTHLRQAGKWKDAAGIVLGYFTNCGTGIEEMPASMGLSTIFRDTLPSDIPVISGYSCGHSLPTMSLPLGASVRLDADHGTLTVLS